MVRTYASLPAETKVRVLEHIIALGAEESLERFFLTGRHRVRVVAIAALHAYIADQADQAGQAGARRAAPARSAHR